MKKAVSLIPFAYLIFRFYLTVMNQSVQTLVVLVCVFAYLIWHFNDIFANLKTARAFGFSFVLFAAVIVLAVVIPAYKGTGDYSFARKLLSEIMNIMCWLAFILHVRKSAIREGRDTAESFAESYCIIITMYVLFSLFCVLVPSFRSFWQTMVPIDDAARLNLTYTKYIGRLGWNGFAAYDSTFMCSAGVFFCISVLIKTKRAVVKKRFLFFLLICLLGNLLYGRTGLITSAVMLVIFYLRDTFVKGRLMQLLRVLLLVAVCFALLFILKSRIPVLKSLYDWAFEPVLNLLKGSGFNSTSSTRILEMHGVRPSLSELLLGDGYYTDPIKGYYYKQVDVGYLRMIFLWGIIPTLFAYIIVFRVFAKSPFCNRFCMVLFMLLFLLFEYKGEIWRKLFVMFVAQVYLRYDYEVRYFFPIVDPAA